MGKNYICERCGKPKEDHVKVDFPGYGVDIGWITLRAGSGFKRNIDLCEDCMEELSEWMEGPQYTTATPTETPAITHAITASKVFALWTRDLPENWVGTYIKSYAPVPECGPNVIKVYFNSGSEKIVVSDPEGTVIVDQRWVTIKKEEDYFKAIAESQLL